MGEEHSVTLAAGFPRKVETHPAALHFPCLYAHAFFATSLTSTPHPPPIDPEFPGTQDSLRVRPPMYPSVSGWDALGSAKGSNFISRHGIWAPLPPP